ncbi:AMP-binding protein [Solirubrobacter ginsenosidimutans]|uniref:AMP-binding protein n=1 Tax=Solirubrobacter ginsenosidimutans TaxID=490573 RepID=A0A9X3MRL2_9ACTN|nr:AMP-binding protein [Solirubrobacter ginsenosidimutans]MDA0159890.1 AMP-binding protein [Solirubrobacter ginsenosidimutans]
MSLPETVTVPLAALPETRAAAQPDGRAIADDTVTLDNTAFADRVARAAALLVRMGVGAGDVVAVALPNRVELIVTLFAAWRVGAAATPVNPALTTSEMQYQVDDAGAKLVIGEGLDLDATVVEVGALAAEPALHAEPAAVEPGALALLIYTSGTTGKPKGVMLDHANLAAMTEMTRAGLGMSAADHSLLILPLFHVNGIVVGTLTPLLAGGRVTVAGRFSPKTFFGLVERVRPTYFSAVPAIYAMLTSLPEAGSADTASLRLVVCGAAPMPAELIARVERTLGVVLVEGYGLSEGSCASTLNPYDGVRKPGTVGLPLPGQEVRVVDSNGDPVPQGERGEVVIRGANVMRGYLNRPEDTAKTVVDGWLHSGDVGVFDPDGYLRIVDRIKDMIIRGGENIYPKEIETVLYSHDAVLEAAVVGRPDGVLGEVVVAYVALRPEADAGVGELHDLCVERLARYKRPVAIELLETLPKNAVGKIDKPSLRLLAAT